MAKGFEVSGDKLFRTLRSGNSTESESTEKNKSVGRGRPPVDRETKKRVSMSLFPSDYENIKKIAFMERVSISDIIGDLINKYVSEKADLLKEYDKLKKNN